MAMLLLGFVASAEKILDDMLLATLLLAATVTGIASWLAATVTGIASWLAAAVTGIASWLAAALFAVLALAMCKQAFHSAEQVMLLATLLAATIVSTAAWLAATVSGVASWLGTTISGTASRFCTTIPGTASRLTGVRAAAVAGSAVGLTARSAALMAAEHPIEDLKTEGLTTNGNAKNQRSEEQHTLHRATSPLLVDPAQTLCLFREASHLECVIHLLFPRQACRAIP